jgi:hypothetical protein
MSAIECEEIIKNSAWVLSNVFTEDECNKLIEYGNSIGYESIEDEYPCTYRNNTRFIKTLPSFARELYMRISKFIPNTLYNKWEKSGLNDYFRFCKYEKNGIFVMHQDTSYRPSFNYQSLLTCMIYLNNTDGGNTRFYQDHNNIKIIINEISPKPGQIIIFDPDIWHDGAKVLSGEKYIIRTEVMYRKIQK